MSERSNVHEYGQGYQWQAPDGSWCLAWPVVVEGKTLWSASSTWQLGTDGVSRYRYADTLDHASFEEAADKLEEMLVLQHQIEKGKAS